MVVGQAGKPIETSVTCDDKIDSSKDSETTCSVTYEDLSVPFEVWISGGRVTERDAVIRDDEINFS